MRIVKEVPNPLCKITIYSWNGKYLIKLEHGLLEQTFKISELEVTEEELDEILNDQFIEEALQRFEGMSKSIRKATL